MPLYEYECRECGDRFERFFHTVARGQQAEAAGIVCPDPECDPDTPARRLVSACNLDIWTPRSIFGVDSGGELGDRPIESRSEYKRLMREQGIQERGIHEQGGIPIDRPTEKPPDESAAAAVVQAAIEQGLPIAKGTGAGDTADRASVTVKNTPVPAD